MKKISPNHIASKTKDKIKELEEILHSFEAFEKQNKVGLLSGISKSIITQLFSFVIYAIAIINFILAISLLFKGNLIGTDEWINDFAKYFFLISAICFVFILKILRNYNHKRFMLFEYKQHTELITKELKNQLKELERKYEFYLDNFIEEAVNDVDVEKNFNEK